MKDDALTERGVADQNGDRDGVPEAQPDKRSSSDVGVALRRAFQAAVNEDVPQEMLDLLRRLD